MKRVFALLSVLLLITSAAAAEIPDISGLTYVELVTLRDQINLAIWQSDEWQEVTVPGGIWKVGKNIPAGHWTISLAKPNATDTVWVFEKLDSPGMNPNYNYYYWYGTLVSENMHGLVTNFPVSIDIQLPDGWYFQCSAEVIFTPYAGKPDLGFK